MLSPAMPSTNRTSTSARRGAQQSRSQPSITPLRERRRDAILTAAAALLAKRGLDVTMDDVAQAAGIGRRTLFRYFPSRSDLLVATMERTYARLVDGLYEPDAVEERHPGELLLRIMSFAHREGTVAGRALWQIAADPDVKGELRRAALARRRFRRTYVPRSVQSLWVTSGGSGRAPRWVVDAFGLLESLHAYYCMHLDFGRTLPEISELTARMMSAVLDAALSESKPRRR
jgi:AcrR family transcriptional regulator